MNDGLKRAFSKQALLAFVHDVGRSYWILLRIMVPAVVIVKLLEEVGATEFLALLLSPLMSLIGLPNEFGLVWAASILTNIYGAMVVFYQLSDGASYSIGQISTMSMLVLVAHALPIEGAVAKALGVPWKVTLLLRIVCSYVFALLVYWVAQFSELMAQPSIVLWSPTPSGEGLVAWLVAQIEMLIGILVILASLMAFLRFLTFVGFDKVLNILLLPLTRLLKVEREASQVTIVGLMLGLSFGAGLLIDAAEKGTISSRDMKIVACFLGLCHSLIEDTLLVILLGAHWVPVLLGRLVFSIIVMALLVRLIQQDPQNTSA